MMRSIRLLAGLICGVVFCTPVFARHSESIEKSRKNVSIEHLNTEDGLSDNAIRCILQDNHGFIWIGTENGLNRYDGNDFKIFQKNPNDSKSLQDNRIKTLYQDGAGNLWVGTVAGGLYRYNPSFENFDHWKKETSADSSLSNNGINIICEDSSGFLWIGTAGGGLNVLNPENGEIIQYRHQAYRSESLIDNHVRALYCERKGDLWVGTDSGLDYFDRKNKKFIHQNLQFPGRIPGGSGVGVIYGDQDGFLWLGTAAGLVRFDPTTGKSRLWQPISSTPESYEENRITAIVSETAQDFWIGTLSGGLFTFDGEHFTAVPLGEDNGGIHTGQPGVSSIYRDSAGILWVGTYNGVYKILSRESKFHDWTEEIGANRLTSNYIWPIYEDHEGVIWIGTIAGLNAYDPASGKITQYIHDANNPNSLSNNAVISIFEDSHKNLWIATFTGGLNRFNRKTSTFEHWQYHPDDPQSLPHNLVSCIFEDHSGTLWIGTAKGLAIFDVKENQPKRFLGAANTGSLHDIYVNDIFEDRNGNYWIATSKSGLFCFDPQKGIIGHWQHDSDDPQSISANAVTEIISMPYGSDSSKFRLWLGTEGGGVNVFDPPSKTFRAYTVAEGLSDNTISSMVVDDTGNIWISTENGLTCLTPTNGKIQTFDERDGIPNSQFNPWAGMKARSGRLYFGTSSGIIYFNPQEFTANISQPPPPVVLTGLEIFNRPVSIGEGFPLEASISETQMIRLSYREFLFSLNFAALDFIKPERNRYAYKLEGLHDRWIDIGHRHRVDFTGLSPGEYVFRVKAANSKGIWNEEGTRLKIIITPPPWKTWWAYSLYGLLAIAGLLLWRKHEIDKLRRRNEERRRREHEEAELREARLRAESAEYQAQVLEAKQEAEKQQIRNRIARDLHDEIGSNLSSLSLIGEVMRKHPGLDEEAREAFEDVNQASRHSIEALRDIVWFINPMSDSLSDLAGRMQETANTMLNTMKHQLCTDLQDSGHKINPDVKRNVFLIFKECLHNIIKHSQASQVTIEIRKDGNRLILNISDDGIGFDLETVETGNGLSNLRSRAEQINGQLTIQSVPGRGTSVSLSVNIT
ncbi:MAG: hypothetical protein D6681_12860 [Calditrichaeota bacterium]|nr:MAG: hypothetical protein D6681_12860 [Calditrichota bacterium]